MSDLDRLNEMLSNVARNFDRLLPQFERLRVAQDLNSLYQASIELEQASVELQIEASRMQRWCEERGAGEGPEP
jgi:hypothetical protein